MQTLKILIIEDDEVDLKRYTERLAQVKSFQFEILGANTASKGLNIWKREDVDCILLDYNMPDMDGLTILRIIRKAKEAVPIIIITGYGNENLAVSAMKEGATDYISKANDDPEILIKTITSAINQIKLQHQITLSKELSEQKKFLLAQQQLRHELLENMSHELNTPLNPILGYAQLMHSEKLGAINSKQREAVATIIKNSQHLKSLISNALDILGFEGGKIELHPEAVHLTQLFNEVKASLNVPLTEKQQQITHEIDHQLTTICVDPFRLKQILFQYLSNAVKFSPDHTVIQIRAKIKNNNRLRIEVEDHGIGIAENKIETIFTAMNQGDASTAKEYQGLGLGLSLSKNIAKAMNGSVGVSSQLGQGSIFFVEIPLVNVNEFAEA